MTKLFIALENNIDPNDITTKDRGYEISLDMMFTVSFFMMTFKNQYNSFADVCTLKENRELELYFLPRNWDGEKTTYLGFSIPPFNRAVDIAIGFKNESLGFTFNPKKNSKFRSALEKKVKSRLGNKHSAVNELYFLFNILDSNSDVISEQNYEIMARLSVLHKNYEELKNRHHLDRSTIYQEMVSVNKTILFEVFEFLDQLIGHTLKGKDIPLNFRQKQRLASKAKRKRIAETNRKNREPQPS